MYFVFVLHRAPFVRALGHTLPTGQAMDSALCTPFCFLLVINMTWKSALGLTLALFVASLVITIAFAPIEQKHKGLLSGTPDYSLLTAQEINHQTLKAAAAIKTKELKASRDISG